MSKLAWLVFFMGGIVSGLSQSVQVAETQGRATSNGGNPLRGTPFLHRLVPGITFQVQSKNHGGFDINPLVGYRFTERLTAGLGWNERLGFHFHHHFGISHRRGVYGPRSFVDVKLVKGFSVRGEVESMNTFVPPLMGVSPPGDVGSRQWVWGVFVGIKKNIRITSGLLANLQLLYNLYDGVYDKSPYADRLNFRFGLEFQGKRKK